VSVTEWSDPFIPVILMESVFSEESSGDESSGDESSGEESECERAALPTCDSEGLCLESDTEASLDL
jgi:hypothetical protein